MYKDSGSTIQLHRGRVRKSTYQMTRIEVLNFNIFV
jgi:hypothetical protein